MNTNAFGEHYTESMMDTKSLARNVLLSRRDLDMTQEQLAELVGVSRAYVTNIELGKAKNVGVDVVFAIAKALGVTVPYLLGLSEDPLGESPGKVMAEQSADYVVFEVDSGEQRRLFREIIDELNALPPPSQRMVLALIKTMRQVEQEQARELPPARVIGQ